MKVRLARAFLRPNLHSVLFSFFPTELLYKAPELLRTVNNFNTILIPGTPKGDIYSFSIILYEIHTR
jgi:hypothetical protein